MQEKEKDKQKKRLLIVGAGPVGLSTALFIATNPNPNISFDIVDKQLQSSPQIQSRAVLLNARSMALFHNHKIQNKFLDSTIWNERVILSSPNFKMLELNFKELLSTKTKYPHWYMIPQSRTQKILEEELSELGVHVKRGLQLEKLTNQQDGVSVKFANDPQQKHYDILLGADGSKSTVRTLAGIDFKGQHRDTNITIADYELEGDLWRHAQYMIGNPQFMLCLPLKDRIIRIVSNFAPLEQYAEKMYKFKLGKKLWESHFMISNRRASTMNVKNVYLAGDSAHAQIPLGGMGMNVGMEDAYVFAHLLKEDRLSEYNSIRMPVIENFIRQMDQRTFILEHKKSFKRWITPYLLKIVGFFVKGRVATFVSGLDHDIPFLGSEI